MRERRGHRPTWLVARCPEVNTELGAGAPGPGPSSAYLCDAGFSFLICKMGLPPSTTRKMYNTAPRLPHPPIKHIIISSKSTWARGPG